MTAKETKPKEPVISVSASPWGEANEAITEPAVQDMFYVAGYTDQRAKNELERREHGKAAPLPYRLQYVSVQLQSGLPDGRKRAHYAALGYVPVLFDEAQSKYGIDTATSGFVKGPDGTCRVGSQMLMACPREKVAQHARLLDERNEAQRNEIKERATRSAEDFNRSMGLSRDGGTAFEFEEKEFKAPR